MPPARNLNRRHYYYDIHGRRDSCSGEATLMVAERNDVGGSSSNGNDEQAPWLQLCVGSAASGSDGATSSESNPFRMPAATDGATTTTTTTSTAAGSTSLTELQLFSDRPAAPTSEAYGCHRSSGTPMNNIIPVMASTDQIIIAPQQKNTTDQINKNVLNYYYGVAHPPATTTSFYQQQQQQPQRYGYCPITWSPEGSSGGCSRMVLNPAMSTLRLPAAAGVWFFLQAAPHYQGNNNKEEPLLLLPQIPKSYLRIKDGTITVRLLMKYLVEKLDLEDESQVEIMCRGQVLEPFQTLQHVRNRIWGAAEDDAVVLLPAIAADHVMTLQYRRRAAAAYLGHTTTTTTTT